MRIALAAVGLAAAAHRAGAEANPELGGPALVDTNTQQSTQSLHRHEGNTSPWWQRAWDAGAQLIKRTPEPQDGQDARVVTVTETVSEDQCSAAQVFTSTINPETTATVTTTKETTLTQYVPQATTGDADDEKTVVITPSDYGVDLPPVTTTVTRYPSGHSWDHSWTAGSWNSEWEGNTATYTETISEIKMPITSTVYSGAENAPTSGGTSAGPSQGTTELSPAGPVIVTTTVTISNVEIPWTTTKTASQEVVTSTFTTTADGSVVTSTFTTTADGSNGGQEVVTSTFTTTAAGSNGGQEVVTSTFTTTADGSNGGQEVVTSTFTTTAAGSNGGQEVVTSTFTTTAAGSNGGAIQPTTITEGNAPQTTVATQPGESAGSSYVYTTVTYTSRLPPFQNPNGTSAVTGTGSTKFPMTNGTQPSASRLTTVTSTFLVPAPTAVETQYTTTFVSGDSTQTSVVTERPTSYSAAPTAVETQYTTTFVSGDSTQTSVVTERPTYSPAPTAVETEYTTTLLGNLIGLVIGAGASNDISVANVRAELYVLIIGARAPNDISVANFRAKRFLGSLTDLVVGIDFIFRDEARRIINSSARFEWTECHVANFSKRAAVVKHSVFDQSLSVVERFGIAASVQLLGLVPRTISDLTILSKLDHGVFTAFEFAEYVDCPGFDFHEPSAFWGSKLDYCGASAFVYPGIFCGDLLELPELLGPSTYDIV
ncbi:hypothetical protein KC349_g7014 [Hortaea werneckii]|nr:hypothetical protein KC349_g7014 [Hortaea werneckii]